MKINVTVDLSDFYSEDESSFSEQIKSAIAYNVRQQILADWKAKIGAEFNSAVIAEIEKQKEQFIISALNELVVNAKVKKRYNSNDMISISEWITEELERTQLSENKLRDFLNSQTTKTSDKISKELKDRYDMLFASQIVAKLHENGMLKEDVAKLLLKE